MNSLVKEILSVLEPIVIAELKSVSSQIPDPRLKTFVQAIIPSLDTYLQALLS